MKMLGLNPMEQEVIDLTNNNVKNGYIYFPEFCNIIHKKYREENEEVFYQDMFKVGDMMLLISSLKYFHLDFVWDRSMASKIQSQEIQTQWSFPDQRMLPPDDDKPAGVCQWRWGLIL